MGQERIHAPSRRERAEDTQTDVAEDMPKSESTVDTKEIDVLLDEIDLVLEENAEEFVRSYQQRGGE